MATITFYHSFNEVDLHFRPAISDIFKISQATTALFLLIISRRQMRGQK